MRGDLPTPPDATAGSEAIGPAAAGAPGTDLDALRLLQELGAKLVTEDNIQAIYDGILDAALRLTRADAGVVQILEPETEDLVVLAARGFPAEFFDHFRRVNRSSPTSCGVALASSGRAFVDFDPADDGDATGTLKLLAEAGFASAQSTPLVGRGGLLIGMLTTHWCEPHRPGERELRHLDLLPRQAADLIKHRQLDGERRQHEARLANELHRQEFLLKLGDALRPLADPLEIQLTASRLLGGHLGANRVGYAEAQADGETIVVPRHHTCGVAGIEGRYRFHDYDPDLRKELLAGRTVIRRDIGNDPSLSPRQRAAHVSLQLGATLNKPLTKGGKLLAVMFIHYRDAHDFGVQEVSLVEEVAERTWAAVERARAEEALRKSQQQLQALFDAAPLGVFLVDSTLRILAINRLAMPSFAKSGNPVGQPLEQCLPDFWDAGADIAVCFHHTLSTGRSHHTPELRRRPSSAGPPTVHEWQIHRFPLPDGSHGAVCYFREITGQIQTREKMVASEARYRTLFDSIDEGFCIVEVLFNAGGKAYDYRFDEINPAFARHTGLKDVEGRTVREFLPDQDQHWFEIYGRIAATGEPARFIEHSAPLDRWFDVYAFRIGGAASRRIGVLFSDITGRRTTEERLHHAAELDAYRVALADALRPLESSHEIQAAAARLLGERLGASRALYVEVAHEPESDYHVIRQGYHAPDVAPLSGRFRANDLGSTLFDEMRAGATLVVSDVATETRLTPAEKNEYPSLGIGAYIAVPLRKAGRQVALVAVHQSEPRAWTADEVTLVEETAERTWDAAERARSELGKRESEQRLMIALESARMAAWDWNVVLDSVRWNDRHYLLLGLAPDGENKSVGDLLGFVHPEDRAQVAAALSAAVEEAGAFNREFRILRAGDREIRWMCGSGQTVESRDGKALRMTGVMYDVTDLKLQSQELQQARDELETRVTERTRELKQTLQRLQDEVSSREKIEHERRELLERLVWSQEAERARVSRELHDNLGQHMVAVLLRLDTFQRQLALSGSSADYHFTDLRAVIDGLIKATHRQSWELRPAELDELGLAVAMENLVQLWSGHTGIEASFHATGIGSVAEPEITIAFYRVAQEALTNVARHAGAAHVDVDLAMGAEPTLSIKDDGCGFDPAIARRRLGLLGMKERLDIIGGTFTIDSAPGRGTAIRASVP